MNSSAPTQGNLLLRALLSRLVGDGRAPFIVTADSSSTFRLHEIEEVNNCEVVDVGVRENLAFGVAAGLTQYGKPVIVATFASFGLRRGYEALAISAETVGAPLIILGGLPGLSASRDGVSHHALDDLALARLANAEGIYVPSTVASVAWLADRVSTTPNVSYIRAYRVSVPTIERTAEFFSDGRTVYRGPNHQVAIVGYGPAVWNAATAFERATVIDLASLLSLSEDFISDLELYANIVSLDEHGPMGGLGDVLSRTRIASRLTRIDVETDPGSGDYMELLENVGLTGRRLRNVVHGMSRAAV